MNPWNAFLWSAFDGFVFTDGPTVRFVPVASAALCAGFSCKISLFLSFDCSLFSLSLSLSLSHSLTLSLCGAISLGLLGSGFIVQTGFRITFLVPDRYPCGYG